MKFQPLDLVRLHIDQDQTTVEVQLYTPAHREKDCRRAISATFIVRIPYDASLTVAQIREQAETLVRTNMQFDCEPEVPEPSAADHVREQLGAHPGP